MPASKGNSFYAILDYIAQTVGDEDAVQQNTHVKEEQSAQDSAKPDQSRPLAVDKEMETEEHHIPLVTGSSDKSLKS